MPIVIVFTVSAGALLLLLGLVAALVEARHRRRHNRRRDRRGGYVEVKPGFFMPSFGETVAGCGVDDGFPPYDGSRRIGATVHDLPRRAS